MTTSPKKILIISLCTSCRDWDEHPPKRSHLVSSLAQEELRLIQPIHETSDPVPQSAEVPSYLVVGGEIRHRKKRFRSRDKCLHTLLDERSRSGNGALQGYVPLPHKDGDDVRLVFRGHALCTRYNVLFWGTSELATLSAEICPSW